MKLPEPAPSIAKASDENIKTMIGYSSSAEVSDLLSAANKEYVYWDKFKYFTMPKGIPVELAWIYLRFIRNSQTKKIPLLDKFNESFGYWLPDSVLKILHYIDQNAAGHLLVEDPAVPSGEKDRYVISSIMEEAIASSQLEGAATTREKAKAMLKSGRKPSNTAEQMILNNYITMKNIKEVTKREMSKELIIQIQASITKETLDNKDTVGRFKKRGEENQVIDPADNTVLYDPPPVDEIDKRIEELCKFANESKDKKFIHPVIKAIILHFWLAYIHPFVDGNGRTARALFYWYMLKNEYWLFEYLSISRILLRAPAQYAKAYLYSEIDGLDLTYFLMYNLRAINLAIKSLLSYLVKQQKEIGDVKKIIRKCPGLNHRQYDLLHHAVSHTMATYNIQYHKNIHKVAYQTARTDFLELENKGFLEKMKTKGKKFVFAPAKDIKKRIKASRG